MIMFIAKVIFSFDHDDVVCFGNDANTRKVLAMLQIIPVIMCAT
jgi:hypothetical protein